MQHDVTLLQCEELPHGFVQLQVDAPQIIDPLPGHYVLLDNNFPCYIQAMNAQRLSFILPKPVLKNKTVGSTLSLSDKQGTALRAPQLEHNTVVVAEGDAINAVLFYAKLYRKQFKGLILIGTKQGFPFKPRPSQLLIDGLPEGVIATLPLLEDWGLANRLASHHEQPGCFSGEAMELARLWRYRHQTELVNIPALTLQCQQPT